MPSLGSDVFGFSCVAFRNVWPGTAIVRFVVLDIDIVQDIVKEIISRSHICMRSIQGTGRDSMQTTINITITPTTLALALVFCHHHHPLESSSSTSPISPSRVRRHHPLLIIMHHPFESSIGGSASKTRTQSYIHPSSLHLEEEEKYQR